MIIGIVGCMGSGKSTVAEIFRRSGVSDVVSLADPFKEVVCSLGLFPREVLWGPSELRSTTHPKYGVTARKVLQTLGTEWGREIVHPDIWVDALLAQYLRKVDRYGAEMVTYVVPDVRFVNEAKRIKDVGGKLIRLWRGANDRDDSHPSEMEAYCAEMSTLIDVELHNENWSLEELQTHVLKVREEYRREQNEID